MRGDIWFPLDKSSYLIRRTKHAQRKISTRRVKKRVFETGFK